MPPCNCSSFKCNGRNQDAASLKRHQKKDREAILQHAQESTSAASKAYLERIEAFVNSPTPSKLVTHDSFNLTELTNALEGDEPPNHQPRTSSPISTPHSTSQGTGLTSYNDRIRTAMQRITNLECEVSSLTSSISAATRSYSETAHNDSKPFPFNSLLKNGEELRAQLRAISVKKASVVEFRDSVLSELDISMDDLETKKRIWKAEQLRKRKDIVHEPYFHDTSRHFSLPVENTNPVLQVLFLTLITLSILFNLPARATRFALEMIRYVLQLAFSLFATGPNQTQTNLLADIPTDPDTLFKKFHLDSEHTIYAVCPNPKCHRTYAPTYSDDSPIAKYSTRCSYSAYPGGSKCGELLLRTKYVKGAPVMIPIKTFLSFSLKDWLAGILSRPDIEDKMDSAWDREAFAKGQDADLHDIFDGSVLKDFKGLDGKHFSLGGEEGRYVFSMCCDWFNPLTVKQGGKKKSIGLIALVCLNLPPDLRYKTENMFLAGVMPGPNEPPLECINHYLTPLVDQLLEFWDHGIYFSRTHRCPHGRRIRCALVAIVCDLPAARKTAGFANFSHRIFCSMCHCHKHKEGFVGAPYSTWKRRTNEECRHSAFQFANALDSKTRESIFDRTGIRCSELLRLPYFDPSHFVVVDAMHNLLLGLVKTHCQTILGLCVKDQSSKGMNKVLHLEIPNDWESFEPKHQKMVKYLHSTLESPMNEEISENKNTVIKRFERRSMAALAFIHKSLGLPQRREKKITLATEIVNWRYLQEEQEDRSLDFPMEDLSELRADIEAMVTPSWTSAIPANLGQASHGKLKADEWRLLGTTYLPASLIRLWGQSQSDGLHEPRKTLRRRRVLDLTMSLFSAISIATAHSTSRVKADLYLQHLQAYVDGVKDLYPNYQFRPNHHMAFHLSEYLMMYGPVHGWWTFPYERMIGKLQRISTNNKMSEYESTIAKSFNRASNLRSMLQKSNCPQAMKNTAGFFKRLVDPQVHNGVAATNLLGSIMCDSASRENVEHSKDWDGHTTPLPKDLVLALNLASVDEHHGLLESHITIEGLTYATDSSHRGNSQVMLRGHGDQRDIPAIIRYIVRIGNGCQVTTYIAVERLKQKQVAARHNPFKRYPFLHVSLYGREREGLEIVTLESIACHYAGLNIDWYDQPLTVVTSLSRA